MREAVHYLVTQKHRSHGMAIANGWAARCVPADRKQIQPGDCLHLVGGLQFGSLEILSGLRARKAPYVFFDRAYFGGGPGSGRLRAVRGAYQKYWIEQRPGHDTDERLKHWGVELQPWRYDGRHILVIPPGDAIRTLFGLGDWLGDTVRRLKACTERPIDISTKQDPRPLAQRLQQCHAVVTWTSNVAVDAIVAGVPAFCHDECAAAPVAGELTVLEHQIDAPPRPDRGPWARSLAWGQFTLDEINAGFARKVVMGSVQ